MFFSFDEFKDLSKRGLEIISGERVLGRRTFYKEGGALVIIGVFILLVALVGALIISRGVERTIVRAIWL